MAVNTLDVDLLARARSDWAGAVTQRAACPSTAATGLLAAWHVRAAPLERAYHVCASVHAALVAHLRCRRPDAQLARRDRARRNTLSRCVWWCARQTEIWADLGTALLDQLRDAHRSLAPPPDHPRARFSASSTDITSTR